MKLFIDSNHLSPYAMSVFVALREKGIPFDAIPVDLQAAEHRAPAYGAISATRRVPCLDDDGFRLSESSAICEYLEARYPGTALYPADIRQRAKAREMQAWLRSDFVEIRTERPTECVFLERSPPPLSSAGREAAGKLFDAVEGLLPQGGHSLFGQWCIADTDLALMLNRMLMSGDPVPERLAQYARAQWQRPSVQAWVKAERPVQ